MNHTNSRREFYIKALLFLVLLISFTIFLDLLVQSIEFNPEDYKKYLKKTNHLFFLAFFFGIIATAIVQSSSAITTLAVAMVAKGDLELGHAIPIVIGSNIGTTITPFIFSFVHSEKRGQFKRALAVAFSHNIFNVLTAILLIFFEFQFGFLSHISTWLGHITYTSMGNNSLLPFFKDGFLKPISVYIIRLIGISWITAIIGFTGMYLSIKGFVKFFTSKNLDQDSTIVNKYIFAQGYKTFFTGLISTAVVHSSSATISILQSFISSYKINTRKAFYFIVGANIGTTFTALLAGLFNKETALCLAFAHFLFNLIGALTFGLIPWLRNINIIVAEFLAEYFEKFRPYLIIYISFLFFIIPLLLICFF